MRKSVGVGVNLKTAAPPGQDFFLPWFIEIKVCVEPNTKSVLFLTEGFVSWCQELCCWCP